MVIAAPMLTKTAWTRPVQGLANTIIVSGHGNMSTATPSNRLVSRQP